MKQTLDKEREEFSLKLKRQTRRVRDLEIKDKHQQNEVRYESRTAAINREPTSLLTGSLREVDDTAVLGQFCDKGIFNITHMPLWSHEEDIKQTIKQTKNYLLAG